MSTADNLSDRQKREKEYYENYAKTFDVDREFDFSPIDGPINKTEVRPWNSYWAFFHLCIDHYKENTKLLDFGSGPGENALMFAKIGYDVTGIDISSENVRVSKELFKKFNWEDKGTFIETVAENMPFEDNHFDVIAGIDILHHVSIKESIAECKRVLKKDGVALFREPIEVPFLDMIRNTSLVKFFFPKTASFENHITHDERKLNQEDMRIIREAFPNCELEPYFLLARFDKFFRAGSDPRPSFLEKLDYKIFKYLPFMKKFGGAIIIKLRNS